MSMIKVSAYLDVGILGNEKVDQKHSLQYTMIQKTAITDNVFGYCLPQNKPQQQKPQNLAYFNEKNLWTIWLKKYLSFVFVLS